MRDGRVGIRICEVLVSSLEIYIHVPRRIWQSRKDHAIGAPNSVYQTHQWSN